MSTPSDPSGLRQGDGSRNALGPSATKGLGHVIDPGHLISDDAGLLPHRSRVGILRSGERPRRSVCSPAVQEARGAGEIQAIGDAVDDLARHGHQRVALTVEIRSLTRVRPPSN